MKILPLNLHNNYTNTNNRNNDYVSNNHLDYDSIYFTGLMPKEMLSGVKMCIFDLDECLLEGSQEAREKVMEFAQSDGRKLVYSSARCIETIAEKIKAGTLVMPDFCVCSNGGRIYKAVGKEFVEIKEWTKKLEHQLQKDKVKELMIGLGREHPFTTQEWIDHFIVGNIPIPDRNIEFKNSKISTYEGADAPSNIRFIVAPDILKTIIAKTRKLLRENNIDAHTELHIYPPDQLNEEDLHRYFSFKNARNLHNLIKPRINPNKSYNCMLINVSDKGSASEYLRNLFGYKPEEIFAAGDAENDFTNANKGYLFAAMQSTSNRLKLLIGKMLHKHKDLAPKIFTPTKSGADGLWEVLCPEQLLCAF